MAGIVAVIFMFMGYLVLRTNQQKAAVTQLENIDGVTLFVMDEVLLVGMLSVEIDLSIISSDDLKTAFELVDDKCRGFDIISYDILNEHQSLSANEILKLIPPGQELMGITFTDASDQMIERPIQ